MEMDSSRGIWKHLQLEEPVPAFVHPTFENTPYRPVPQIKGLSDPNYPKQLSSRLSTIDYSSPIPPKLDTIQANPTTHHRASSQYVSPWRSVARWETNGADLLPSVVCEERDYGPDRAVIALLRRLGGLDENAVRNMGLAHLLDEESECSSTVSASEMELEIGQIAFPNPCPETNAESFPSSNIGLFPLNDSHSDDISANPSWSPLSPSLSSPPPPPMFPRPSNISENPEWSPLWLALPPLREMVSLTTYQVPVTANSGANVDDAQVINDPELPFGANVAALQPVYDPKDEAIDMLIVTVSRQEPSPS